MDRNARTILTVGHSNHELEYFIGLLDRHRVSALADVRSAPYSRFNPQFNRGGRFAEALKASGIRYVYLGSHLGGRSDDLSCYDEHGRIRYDRLACTPRFREGLQRIERGAETYSIALMCAEKEPLDCHRTLLVGHQLDRRGVGVAHILEDETLEPHTDTMGRLLKKLRLGSDGDLLNRQRPRDERIEEAITRQSERVGHSIGQVNSIVERQDQ